MTDKSKSCNVSGQEFVEQSSKSIFQSAYDFVRSCLSNNKIQVHEVVVEKADLLVGNQKPVGSKVIVCSESIEFASLQHPVFKGTIPELIPPLLYIQNLHSSHAFKYPPSSFNLLVTPLKM